MNLENNKKTEEKELDFKIAYQGKMFEIIEWEGKPGVMFETAVRSPGVRLLIECEKDNKKALLMTKEYRRERGVERFDYRLPGGKVFDTLDELNTFKKEAIDISGKVLEAAKKEGKEEAGISGGEFSEIEVSKAGASVEWDLHYFIVKDSEFGEQELEEYEKGDIEIIVLTVKEIFEKLKLREIKEGRTADVLWSWLAENGYIKFSE